MIELNLLFLGSFLKLKKKVNLYEKNLNFSFYKLRIQNVCLFCLDVKYHFPALFLI